MADYDKFQIRFPDGMRDALEAAAKKNNHSLHQEILNRLRSSLDVQPVETRLAKLEAEVFKKGK